MTEKCKKCGAKLSGTSKDAMDKDRGEMTLFCPSCDTKHIFKRTRLGNWDLRKY
jgi:DNA-directed RNA polymerase subunit RPC12/RpoP